MQRRYFILLLLLTYLATGCVTPLSDLPDERKTGDLSLVFRTAAARADTKSSDPVTEGNQMKDLLVLVTSEEGTIIGKVLRTFPEPKDTANVSFSQLSVGSYHVYAYANINQTHSSDWFDAGQSVMDVENQLAVGASYSRATASSRKLKTLPAGGTNTPMESVSSEMLLTGYKKLPVGVHTNIGEVELLRPVVCFNLHVYNHTDVPLRVGDLHFSAFNPDQTFLLEQLDEDGHPVIPNETHYRSLPAYNPADAAERTVPAVHDKTVYSTLLYENQAPTAYKVFATITMDPDGLNKTQQLASSGVELLSYNRIAGMSINEEINVLMVTPNAYSSSGAFVGYNESTNKTIMEKAALMFEEFYQSEAESLMRSDERFILKLKKLDGGYQVRYGENNLFARLQKGDNNQYLEVGTLSLGKGNVVTSGNYKIPEAFSDSLCQFYSGEYYLYRRDNAQDLRVFTGQTEGNYMWAFYEAHPLGSKMLLIDNQTSQVSTLSRMVRNQEINVVLNVYYGVTDGILSFEVSNDYWNDQGSTSSHSFGYKIPSH